jgi:hypothetical protein
MIRDATPSTDIKITEKVPEYKNIDKIVISKSLLKNLIKFSQNSGNLGVEGFLFGHEGENEINVENAFPGSTDESSYNVVNQNNKIISKYFLKLFRGNI